MPYSDMESVCGSVGADFHRVSEGVLTEDGDLPLSTDYNLYTNSQLPTTKEINALPLKTVNVEFARHMRQEGKPLREAVAVASRLRLRPILMTSLATILGLIPMAMKLGTGSEAYAPLARAIIGGLLVSVVVTVYLVPAAYVIVHRKSEARLEEVHS